MHRPGRWARARELAVLFEHFGTCARRRLRRCLKPPRQRGLSGWVHMLQRQSLHSPCPDDLGNTQCLDSSALKICTARLLRSAKTVNSVARKMGPTAPHAPALRAPKTNTLCLRVGGLSNQSGEIADHEDLSIHTVNGDGRSPSACGSGVPTSTRRAFNRCCAREGAPWRPRVELPARSGFSTRKISGFTSPSTTAKGSLGTSKNAVAQQVR